MNLHDIAPNDPWAHIPLMTPRVFDQFGEETRGRLYETRIIQDLPYGIWSAYPRENAEQPTRYIIYLEEWEGEPELARPEDVWFLYEAQVMGGRYWNEY